MPEIPTLASLGVIIGILVVVTLTSLAANRRQRGSAGDGGDALVDDQAHVAELSDRH